MSALLRMIPRNRPMRLVLAVLLAGPAASPAMAALTQPVKIQTGLVSGVPGRDPAIQVFKGIPFAAPPVGDLRWKAPQAPAANAPPPRPVLNPFVYNGPVVPLTAPGDVPRNVRGFIAIEPMAGITNSLNLAQKGVYKELQYVAPGGSWNESIWITPSGY